MKAKVEILWGNRFNPAVVLDTQQKLDDWIPLLQSAEWIALDTEADSLHAYPEKLCLLQCSIAAGDFLVDPLARLDLSGFWNALKDRELIFHGADYDLRLLRRQHDFVPSRIFDTMLAARLIGCDRFGLADLVSRYLQVILEKGPQKADWAQRPLSPRMEVYARNDTRYLKPLSDMLRAELQRLGRLPWFHQWCERWLREGAAVTEPDPDEVWRVKGSHMLAPAALAVVRELWHWRDAAARAANRPPYFILRHETLIDLAVASVQGRSLIPLLPKRFSSRHKDGVLEAIQRGLDVPPERQPQKIRRVGRPSTPAENHRFDKLQERRNRIAEQLKLDPSLVATKSQLIAISRGEPADLMPWQQELLGL